MVDTTDRAIELHLRELHLTGNAYVKYGLLKEAIRVYTTAINFIDCYHRCGFVDLRTARDIRHSRLACYIKLNMTQSAEEDFDYLLDNPIAPETHQRPAQPQLRSSWGHTLYGRNPLVLDNSSTAKVEDVLVFLHHVGSAYADRGEFEVAIKLYTMVIGLYSHFDCIDPRIVWDIRVSRYTCYLALNMRDKIAEELVYFGNNAPPLPRSLSRQPPTIARSCFSRAFRCSFLPRFEHDNVLARETGTGHSSSLNEFLVYPIHASPM